MIDWNGNGKIDLEDIGICLAIEEDDDDDEKNESTKINKENRIKPQPTGCMTSITVILIISVIICAMLFMGR